MLNLAHEADHALLAYIEGGRVAQDLLCQVLTQLAGYSLMLMTTSRRPNLAEQSIRGASAAAARAFEDIRALAVPSAARHHHHHLCKAAEAARHAFAAAERCGRPDAGEAERDALTRALQAATAHLRVTARLLPGFEMVDFDQACCALHAPAPAGGS